MIIKGMTCGEYTEEFMKTATGYMTNLEGSGDQLCGYCQYNNGDEFLATFDWKMANMYVNTSFFFLLFLYLFISSLSCY